MLRFAVGTALVVSLFAGARLPAALAQPTPQQALKLAPVQPDIDYDKPPEDQIPNCTVEAETAEGHTAWVVRSPSGQLLRRFMDSNGDNRVDRWCYFLGGIEVYRDIDSDFNLKADQYRWMGTAGIRWGLDKDEDGKIDDWRAISPEEVSSEFVLAVRQQDAKRLESLLLRPDELADLGLEGDFAKQIRERLEGAGEGFLRFARAQKNVSAKTRWVDFGAQRPSLLPAGTGGLGRDLVFYDAVVAMIETDGQHGQLPVGTLVQLGERWRLVPTGWDSQAIEGLFVQVSHLANRTIVEPGATLEASPRLQELVKKLEELDSRQPRNPQQQAQWNVERADVLEQLAGAVVPADRPLWLRQLADLICAATQAGQFPGGNERLEKLATSLEEASADVDLLAYVRFCTLQADYATKIQKPDADYAKIQEEWIASLEGFIEKHGESPEAAEAMLQLAVAHEFAGADDKAKEWFGQVTKRFPDSDAAPKAAGATRRLESVGRSIEFSGKTLDGQQLDVQRLRGRYVLIHYWATWCEPCTRDMEVIAQLLAKYTARKFTPVGVSVDGNREELAAFLRQKRINWPQLHEPKGLDGPLATQLGVFTLPVMILIGPDGTVVSRGITIAELQQELEQKLK